MKFTVSFPRAAFSFSLIIVIMAVMFALGGSSVSAATQGIVCAEGDEGMAVATLQLKLKKAGFYEGNITGKYDKKTASAVSEFQEKKQLKVSGQVDNATYELLTQKPAPVLPVKSGNRQTQNSNLKDNFTSATATPVISTAKQYMGTPYRFGGESPSGFDCSGYIMYVFKKHNVNLPRTADIQYTVGRAINKPNLQPGDLVFFTTYAPGASHVGIYTENGNFIHASSSKGVMISGLDDSYWRTRYLGARRVL